MLDRHNLHAYQERGVSHIIDVPRSALFLDMGLGKTVTTLTAIDELMYDRFNIKKVLIIAPLRVANTVWHTEAKNWGHTKGLTFTIVTGSMKERVAKLQRSSDIYVTNKENVKWIVEYYKGKFPFDMVVIDESSTFKSYSSQRFKALKTVLHKITRMVLLTGTPASNGYMDLWSQIFLLDGGARLGKNITAYRSRYFEKDFMGFNYILRPSAVSKIQESINPLILSMSAKDYLELPEFIPTVLSNKLEGDLLKQYKTFEKDMIMSISSEDKITAMSAATLSNKLLQFCSGNVYREDKTVHHIHNLKVDTLKEVIEANPDDNILVAYNYKHELAALQAEFKDAVVMDKEGLAVEAWNEGKIKILLTHPLSAGHGLNLQKGGSIIVWYGFTWSLESYQQFNARLYRQGQTEKVRVIHIAVGTIEDRLMKALADKDVTQATLLESLK
jgi:SNF2 family DNA or RNA helicase